LIVRTAFSGAVVALVAAVVAVVGSSIGITTLWPLLLAAAIGLATASGSTVGRVAAFVSGAVLGAVVFAAQAGFLPQSTMATVVLVVLGIGLVTGVGIVSKGHLPMWAGLAGYAAFNGLYAPVFADTPTRFLTQAPGALATLLLSAAFGGAAALVVDMIAGPEGRPGSPAAPGPSTPIANEGELV
jgi:hypothetical protein